MKKPKTKVFFCMYCEEFYLIDGHGKANSASVIRVASCNNLIRRIVEYLTELLISIFDCTVLYIIYIEVGKIIVLAL